MVSLERLSRALAGRYEIERELGRGGTSIVYLAQDSRHQRHVALKVLDPELATSVGADRFLLEIRTTAQLNHPHVLPLHDSGEADGLLYYVIPYVQGESLRGRLQGEQPLPVDDAVRIAAEVGDALAYAHSHGFIHRDIKPENILLGHAGHTYVADFGLARAVFGSEPARLTSGQLAVGTPWYMSPEQAAGDSDVGPSTDVYSLGCVFFEMLAGEPPFHPQTVQAVLASHISAAPPSVRALRPDVPDEVERILLATLVKDPAERPSAEQVTAGLQHLRDPVAGFVSGGRPRARISWPLGLTLGAAIVLAVLLLWFDDWTDVFNGGSPADTTRYVVFPVDDPNGAEGVDLTASLTEALREWRDITVVDFLSLQGELARRDADSLDLEAARAIAHRLGAGRMIMSRVIRETPQRVFQSTLYGTTTQRIPALSSASQALPEDVGARGEALQELAYTLLFPGIRGIDGPIDHPGTRWVPALRAYVRGHEALRQWDLDAADSAFSDAGDLDPDFGEAQLWLAQVRGWASDDPIDRLLASRAVSHIEPDDRRHFRLAQALVHLSEGEFPEACELYDSLVEEDENDFVAWYGLGECLRRDELVVADEASPSGYAFRASNQRALEAYERAFSIRPEMMTLFSVDAYDRLRELLVFGSALVREGRTENGDVYLAFPALVADTVAFTPFSTERMGAGSPGLIPDTRAQAIRWSQQRFAALAGMWVERQPTSPQATEALGVAQEMLGDPEALETFQHARELATDSAVAARIGAEQVWLMLRSGLPDDTLQLRRARAMADSLLDATAAWDADDRHQLASLAALVGRPELTGRLWAANPGEKAIRERWGPDIVRESSRLLAYAAIGRGRDSLEAIEQRLLRMIHDQLPPAEQGEAEKRLLLQAAGLALPLYRFESLDELDDALARIAYALTSGDTVAASDREYLAAAQARSPVDRALDAVFVEAWLMVQLGDAAGAADHLDRRLQALGSGAPALLGNPGQMAALVRAICLRLDIAGEGDPDLLGRWRRSLRIIKRVDAGAPHSAACGDGLSTP